MGALCGKESSADDTPAGRVLGSGAPGAGAVNAGAGTTSRIASKQKKPKVGGPPRTLAGSSGGGATPPGGEPEDPRAAAARAAELRNAQGRPGSGKIATRLDEQKRKTHNQHLVDASRENHARRDQTPVWD